MDDTVSVRVIECRSHGDCDSNGLVEWQLPIALQPGSQRLTVHVRHYVVEKTGRLAAVEQRQQVRMLQVGGDLDLGEKPFAADYRAELGVEDLDRDPAMMFCVARQVDRCHSTSADLALDDVAIGEYLAEAVERGHGTSVSESWCLILKTTPRCLLRRL
jgi:hypothetical protein